MIATLRRLLQSLLVGSSLATLVVSMWCLDKAARLRPRPALPDEPRSLRDRTKSPFLDFYWGGIDDGMVKAQLLGGPEDGTWFPVPGNDPPPALVRRSENGKLARYELCPPSDGHAGPTYTWDGTHV